MNYLSIKRLPTLIRLPIRHHSNIKATADNEPENHHHHHHQSLSSPQQHHPQELDEEGQPYNEMTALPFNRHPGIREPPDWIRRIFVVGYMGGLALFCMLVFYRPDTTLETWAWNEAVARMRQRGTDLSWLDRSGKVLVKTTGVFQNH